VSPFSFIYLFGVYMLSNNLYIRSDETVSSLGYATRVKKITNNASKQAESEEVARLKAMIKRLQGGGGADPEPEPTAEHEEAVPTAGAGSEDNFPDDGNVDFDYKELDP
jgi:hypothetical protein